MINIILYFVFSIALCLSKRLFIFKSPNIDIKDSIYLSFEENSRYYDNIYSFEHIVHNKIEELKYSGEDISCIYHEQCRLTSALATYYSKWNTHMLQSEIINYLLDVIYILPIISFYPYKVMFNYVNEKLAVIISIIFFTVCIIITYFSTGKSQYPYKCIKGLSSIKDKFNGEINSANRIINVITSYTIEVNEYNKIISLQSDSMIQAAKNACVFPIVFVILNIMLNAPTYLDVLLKSR